MWSAFLHALSLFAVTMNRVHHHKEADVIGSPCEYVDKICRKNFQELGLAKIRVALKAGRSGAPGWKADEDVDMWGCSQATWGLLA